MIILETRLLWMQIMKALILLLVMMNVLDAQPRRILIDTDVDIDDIFGLFYLLKQNRSKFDLQGITINANGWSDGGHAVNHVYDILFMMNRDDIPVGVGGEGGIFPNATILPNVGGYLPIIDQGNSTAGECRYRQAIPVGRGGRLDINSNYGLRRAYLPQGNRRYIPLEQPTAQQVMIDAISAGPITVFLMGAHTNFALFLVTNPHLKKNVEHIYIMGGSIGPDMHGQIGNLYPQDVNPYAEFNIFQDPFAAYISLYSGIPITLIPLDATRTIPIDENFFSAFEQKQDTYEAQYSFQSLKMVRDTWLGRQFYEQYCMWDSFMVGVALSQMRNSGQSNDGENEFAEMEYVNITVVTSNEPYGISDGSNPLLDEHPIAKFSVQKNGVHSGHIQIGMQDPFCLDKGKKGKCQDGYTKKVSGEEAVQVLIATEAKANRDKSSSFGKEFFKSFLDVLNRPAQSGRFNITTQFPYYRETLHKPDFERRTKGKAVVFDMDMSVGDFLALFYLLKLPVELIDLKGILVSANGWATAATVDVVYDVLHMMGRDDIPVGLGDVFAMGQTHSAFPAIGDCAYNKYIPHGSGGFLDSDTLYGLAHHLPRSPRRYTAENLVKFGAPRDTDHPELRQPSALEVWNTIVKSLNPGDKISILTNGPLTNLAQIILSDNHKTSSVIQDVYIVGGQTETGQGKLEKGNLFTVPSNEYAEFNMFLDPLAAKTVFDSKLDIILIPLHMQKRVSSFHGVLHKLNFATNSSTTPEAVFARRLLLRLYRLHRTNHRYLHLDMFLGEILGAVILAAENYPQLNQKFKFQSLKVLAEGDISKLGQIIMDEEDQEKKVKVLDSINPEAYYDQFANQLGDNRQSAVIRSFDEQKRIWSTPPKRTDHIICETNLIVVSIVLMFGFAVHIKYKVMGK